MKLWNGNPWNTISAEIQFCGFPWYYSAECFRCHIENPSGIKLYEKPEGFFYEKKKTVEGAGCVGSGDSS